MRFFILILTILFSHKGLSQNKLEMVSNGDFNSYTKFQVPVKKWMVYFREKCIPKPGSAPADYSNFNQFSVLDNNGWRPVGINAYYPDVANWMEQLSSFHMIDDWYPYRVSSRNTVIFDSVVYQDTFHFYRRDQFEYSGNAFSPFTSLASKTMVRVCGKNLYPLATKLKVGTRDGAYYVMDLDLMYDYQTYLSTMYYKGYLGAIRDSVEKKYPEVRLIAWRQRSLNYRNAMWFLENYCNATLDSNKYSRNNNFKITLLNRYFDDSSDQKTQLKELDIWNMPLFKETDQSKHFVHHFKSIGDYGWLQLSSKHPDSIEYYPNDTSRLSANEDSLLYFITDRGKKNQLATGYAQLRFYTSLAYWPYVKQWRQPGKVRRYADKALRNADYFLDNLSLQPEMYQKGAVAAPTVLCEADTFLAFIPSGSSAIWIDLISGKILSRADSCWITLTDTVSIEVRNAQFVDTLNYSLRKPKSPFTKDSYSLCLGDSLVFSTTSGYKVQWQWGQSSAQQYVHRYVDSSKIEATFTSPLGCKFKYITSVLKGPSINQYSLDTFLCDKPFITWEVPGVSWVSSPIQGVTQDAKQLTISTPTDVKKNTLLLDTLSGCSVALAINIRSNQTPNLGKDIDTVICPDNSLNMNLHAAEFHWLNGVKSTNSLNLETAGDYTVMAANQTCADTLNIHLEKFPSIQVSVNQLNPWTCFLDSALLFVASPSEYQYFWSGSGVASKTNATQDSGLLRLLAIDSHGCELKIQIRPQYSCNKPVWIPNVFTPNGTNLNETFGPHCISCKTNYIQIYNRWGECIYKGSESWDGTYRGEPVPNGTYAYKIGVELWFGSNSKPAHFYGDVQVLR